VASGNGGKRWKCWSRHDSRDSWGHGKEDEEGSDAECIVWELVDGFVYYQGRRDGDVGFGLD